MADTLIELLDPSIFYYLAGINIFSFILMLYDKLISKRKNPRLRIPEKSLLLLTALGGAFGSFIVMAVFRHKTKHTSFKIIVPLCLCLWLGFFVYVAAVV